MSLPDPTPVPFTFTKARAEYLIDCILTGQPIGPEDGKHWDPSDLISTAGLLLSGANHGPCRMRDLCAAAAFAAQLTELVDTDLYDAQFEPVVTAYITMGDDFRPDVEFITGDKEK